MKLIKFFLLILFITGLVYLILPGPTKISDIPPLPDSQKSTEPGDTYQNPNNSAYFSNYYRNFVTKFYKDSFGKLNNLGGLIPPIRLNHPPEMAFQYVRDQQHSTYLEEYLYPWRDSLFVNGYEPYDEKGKAIFREVTEIIIAGEHFNSKTTLRFYHSEVYHRVIVYLLFWATFIAFLKLAVKAIKTK